MPTKECNQQNIGWRFDNSYAQLPEHFYSRMSPIPVPEPRLAIFNTALSKELGLNLQNISASNLAELLSGNMLPDGSQPIAQAYAGHQFGHFTLLGDGRAHLLGEHTSLDGKRFDVQLKGSGKTPFGRRGDGRAALGPMLREYIISEAMHALGISTTRSLAVVYTGEPVYRETTLQGAVLTRIASSHIRVGTFAYFAATNDGEGLKTLADYTIAKHYPESKDSAQPYLDLLSGVMERQANLIVDWLRVGFIHGVMNTDNMAVSGETIDYGPCAFMDSYDPATVFSSIDQTGRYAYGNQPHIAQWNLMRFAETLIPLLHETANEAIKLAEEKINAFPDLFQKKWQAMMRAKLGLLQEQPGDELLIRDLLKWMQQQKTDFTNTFRNLSDLEETNRNCKDPEFQTWFARWQLRLPQNPETRQEALEVMNQNNPAIIPRNHQVEQALNAAANGDMKQVHELLEALQTPYINRPEIKAYQSPPPPSEQVYQTFCGT